MPLRVGLVLYKAAFLLAAALGSAEECKDGTGLCHSDIVDEASLLSFQRLRTSEAPANPAMSCGMRPRTQGRPQGVGAAPVGACPVGAHVKCPYSGNMCAGAQCCPSAGNADATFPCPSAPETFAKCENNTKVWDCLRGSTPSTVAGAELATSSSFKYGKFEASIQYAGMDGVISSFFLWKPDSEKSTVYWNELDYEKAGITRNGECKLQLNLIDGMPGPENHEKLVSVYNICTEFHTYAFEWTPDYVKWTVDGVEMRSMTGSMVESFNQQVEDGMQFHFNVWPGDSNFGGNFSMYDLPLYQYIDWVRYSSYSEPDNFTLQWQEDFTSSSLPEGWFLGNWPSPSGHSIHRPDNVVFTAGMAVLALTQTWDVPTASSIPPP